MKSNSLEQFYDVVRQGERAASEQDWGAFFGSNILVEGHYVCLLEKLEVLQRGHPAKYGGVEDVYQATTKDGQAFVLRLTYITPENTNGFLTRGQATARKHDNTVSDKYKQSYDNLHQGQQACFVMFKDQNDRTSLTGQVGIYALEVFSAIRQAVLDSMWGEGGHGDATHCIVVRVDLNEMRRMSLYKKIAQRYLSDKFPNIFEDLITEADQGMGLLVISK